jgi:NAD(P)-dependent dehydrogenase (short-subunit alcohol dehydrogenase family)
VAGGDSREVANLSLSSRVAVVTGASRGIGRATALALAAEGYAVVLAGRSSGDLGSVAAEVESIGAPVRTVRCDVTEEVAVQALFQETLGTFGHVDLLFNNAGTASPAVPLEELSLASWSAVVATNLTGTFLCTREAFLAMKEQEPQGGRIINNGSLAAHSPRPNTIAYAATKHAITGLTKSTSLEGRKYGIACGQIDIGNASTEMSRSMAEGVEQADGSIRAEPMMSVSDVARAVVFMASLPLGANVQFITVMASAMPFIGRG